MSVPASAPPPPSSPSFPNKGSSINLEGWTITSTKYPILNSEDSDSATASLGMPLPEICFGKNGLRVEDSKSGVAFEWDTMNFLREVEVGRESSVKVAHAKEWARGQAAGGSSEVKVVNPFDWTYTTPHRGALLLPATVLSPTPQFLPAPPTHPGIPLHKLARQDIPVVFFDEVPLFEDELGDNGIAEVNVRVRVNEFSVFVLARFFLRVDGVLFRIRDTRLYHEFGTREVIRETKGRQASYNSIKGRLPADRPTDLSTLTDVNWVAAQLEILATAPPSRGPGGRTPAPWATRPTATETGALPPAMAALSLAAARNPFAASPSAGPVPDSVEEAPLPEWNALGKKLEVLQLPLSKELPSTA